MSVFGPLFRYELTRLARRGLQPRLRVAFAALLLGVLFLTYLRTFPRRDPLMLVIGSNIRLSTAGAAAFGERFLAYFLIVQLVVVVLITPVVAGGAMTDEKDRRTLDFLLASPLTSWEIVLGKMAARLVFVGGVVLTGLPVLTITMLFGGVDAKRLLSGYALALLTMLSIGAFSLYLSVVTHSLASVLWRVYALAVGLTVLGFCSVSWVSPTPPSPFPALMTLLESRSNPILAMMIGYTVFHVLVAASFLGLAANRLRPRWLRPTGPEPCSPVDSVPRADNLPAVSGHWVGLNPWIPPVVRERRVPRLRDGDNPLLWKELWFTVRFWSTDRLANSRFQLIVFSIVILICTAVVIAAAESRISGRQNSSLFGAITQNGFALLIPGLVSVLGVLAARSVVGERQRQTLDLLLNLPGDRHDILRAKAWAAVRAARPLLSLAAAGLMVGVVTGGTPPTCLLVAPLLVVGWGTFAIGYGMWLSCWCQTTARATGCVLATTLLMCMLPPLPRLVIDYAPALEEPLAQWGEGIWEGLSPVMGTWNGLSLTERPRWRNRPNRGEYPNPVSVIGAVYGALIAGRIGLGFWWAAVRRFEV